MCLKETEYFMHLGASSINLITFIHPPFFAEVTVINDNNKITIYSFSAELQIHDTMSCQHIFCFIREG